MQVHKEAIDKVPNSLPNRSNIEIEIYGMEGIPAQDLKDHEKGKNGSKSDSDEDEPSAKKNKLEPAAAAAAVAMQPQMMMPNMVHPNMSQFPMMMQRELKWNNPLTSCFDVFLILAGFPMMQGIPMIPMMGHRPLFPSAIATSASQQKPTFPAYSNATISAPPTVSTSNNTSTNVSDTQKPPTIPQTAGTASKIIHPPEDVSLEEIRARKPQYRPNKSSASPQNSSSSTPTSAASNAKYNESKMVQAAQEVSSKPMWPASVSLFSLCLVDVCV